MSLRKRRGRGERDREERRKGKTVVGQDITYGRRIDKINEGRKERQPKKSNKTVLKCPTASVRRMHFG